MPIQSLQQNSDSSCILELKAEIENMNQKLKSADQEIENLILENNKLIITVHEQKKQIEVLKKLTQNHYFKRVSTNTASPISRKLLNINMRAPRTSPLHSNKNLCLSLGSSPIKYSQAHLENYLHSPTSSQETLKPNISTLGCVNRPTSALRTDMKNHPSMSTINVESNKLNSEVLTAACCYRKIQSDTQVQKSYIVQKVQKSNGSNPSMESGKQKKYIQTIGNEQKNSTIFIIGDQQVKGLSSKMLYARAYKWNDVYRVSALVKPYALCSDILSYCTALVNQLKTNDKIVISVGANERNPYLLIKNLSLALHTLQDFQVYILQITENKYIQESKLNDIVYSLAKTYSNCNFIKLNKIDPSQDFLSQLTTVINLQIDGDDYALKFLPQSKTKIRSLNNTWYKKLYTSITKSKQNCKGTIPYLFQKQTEKLKIQENELKTQSMSNNPKKGTIPYYFKKHISLNSKTIQKHQLFRSNI